MTPHRIQRKRIKGWKMPENTVYVGRGTKFGNYYKVGMITTQGIEVKDRAMAVKLYKADLLKYGFKAGAFNVIKDELQGSNLACWCPLDQPCHADVLLKIANN